MDTKIGQLGEATNHQWMINIEVAAVLNVCSTGHFLDAHWVFISHNEEHLGTRDLPQTAV